MRRVGRDPGEGWPIGTWQRHTRWLTCLTIEPDLFGADREAVRLALEAENIEARPVWKPMHLQPVFADCEYVGLGVAEDLFARGLCLPSGSGMTSGDLERVVDCVVRVRSEEARYQKLTSPWWMGHAAVHYDVPYGVPWRVTCR